MLLDSNYTIVPSIRFTLTFDNDIRKVITVKTRDKIDCTYKRNGERFNIVGIVSKIGCNFNSSLGAIGTTAYIQVDGSSEYSGQVEYIQPSQVLDLTVISTTDITDNVVCSVDNEDQRISLIRENEVGVFQYSLDGITWNYATGGQGMSAYECAVKLGFEGTEAEWLESLKGKQGEPGEPGGLEIYKVFKTIAEAENNRDLIPKGKLVAVQTEPNSILLCRNGTNKAGNPFGVDEAIVVIGYDYLGYLTVGPKGDKGDKGDNGTNGKSAYQYAVEGGFAGSEDEFMQIMSRCAVAITNFYMGPTDRLFTNTVMGPIDLRIFGYTNERTFKSKAISKIDISCPTEIEDQSLIFPEPVILRAVPTAKESAKPNVIIKGQKYVADCIMKKDGKVGVMRRVKYIASYNGETILGDWISSTGELDMGAQVQFTTYGHFEPFEETVQSQYKKLHSYDNKTEIIVNEPTHMSVAYPINITQYIEEYVDEKVQQYLEEKAPAIIKPIVIEEVSKALDTKQDKLVQGDHIFIDSTNKISVTDIGELPDGKTVVQYVDGKDNELALSIASVNNKIIRMEASKQDKLTAGTGITIDSNNVISATGGGTGTVTAVKVNGVTKQPVSGVVDIGTVVTEHQSLANYYNKSEVDTKLTAKQDKLTAGSNITIDANNVISATGGGVLEEAITVTKEVGGYSVGDVIAAGTSVNAILKQMLSPYVPPETNKVYFGVKDAQPTTIEGLESQNIEIPVLLANGITHRYTANNQYFVYAYKKSIGELISIKDPNGFENIDGWSKRTYSDGTNEYYIYYTNENLTVTSYKMAFIYTED